MSAVTSHTDQPSESLDESVSFFIPHEAVHASENVVVAKQRTDAAVTLLIGDWNALTS